MRKMLFFQHPTNNSNNTNTATTNTNSNTTTPGNDNNNNNNNNNRLDTTTSLVAAPPPVLFNNNNNNENNGLLLASEVGRKEADGDTTIMTKDLGTIITTSTSQTVAAAAAATIRTKRPKNTTTTTATIASVRTTVDRVPISKSKPNNSTGITTGSTIRWNTINIKKICKEVKNRYKYMKQIKSALKQFHCCYNNDDQKGSIQNHLLPILVPCTSSASSSSSSAVATTAAAATVTTQLQHDYTNTNTTNDTTNMDYQLKLYVVRYDDSIRATKTFDTTTMQWMDCTTTIPFPDICRSDMNEETIYSRCQSNRCFVVHGTIPYQYIYDNRIYHKQLLVDIYLPHPTFPTVQPIVYVRKRSEDSLLLSFDSRTVAASCSSSSSTIGDTYAEIFVEDHPAINSTTGQVDFNLIKRLWDCHTTTLQSLVETLSKEIFHNKPPILPKSTTKSRTSTKKQHHHHHHHQQQPVMEPQHTCIREMSRPPVQFLDCYYYKTFTNTSDGTFSSLSVDVHTEEDEVIAAAAAARRERTKFRRPQQQHQQQHLQSNNNDWYPASPIKEEDSMTLSPKTTVRTTPTTPTSATTATITPSSHHCDDPRVIRHDHGNYNSNNNRLPSIPFLSDEHNDDKATSIVAYGTTNVVPRRTAYYKIDEEEEEGVTSNYYSSNNIHVVPPSPPSSSSAAAKKPPNQFKDDISNNKRSINRNTMDCTVQMDEGIHVEIEEEEEIDDDDDDDDKSIMVQTAPVHELAFVKTGEDGHFNNISSISMHLGSRSYDEEEDDKVKGRGEYSRRFSQHQQPHHHPPLQSNNDIPSNNNGIIEPTSVLSSCIDSNKCPPLLTTEEEIYVNNGNGNKLSYIIPDDDDDDDDDSNNSNNNNTSNTASSSWNNRTERVR